MEIQLLMLLLNILQLFSQPRLLLLNLTGRVEIHIGISNLQFGASHKSQLLTLCGISLIDTHYESRKIRLYLWLQCRSNGTAIIHRTYYGKRIKGKPYRQ